MKISQLSLFIENKPGTLNRVCQCLKKHNINISTLSLADTEQFGILRLLVQDPEKARQLLEADGFIVKVTEVLALPVPDRPGGLADILDILDGAGLSIEYMYAFTFGNRENAIMVFRFEDTDRALKVLSETNVDVVKAEDLLS